MTIGHTSWGDEDSLLPVAAEVMTQIERVPTTDCGDDSVKPAEAFLGPLWLAILGTIPTARRIATRAIWTSLVLHTGPNWTVVLANTVLRPVSITVSRRNINGHAAYQSQRQRNTNHPLHNNTS